MPQQEVGTVRAKVFHCRLRGIAGNSAVGKYFVCFNCGEKCRSLAIFDDKDIAKLGALKIAILWGAVKIAAATDSRLEIGGWQKECNGFL